MALSFIETVGLIPLSFLFPQKRLCGFALGADTELGGHAVLGAA
ncbi:hypothetical protein [Methylobacter sp.]|nr:hypothetical protein [Methylobacter sp.]